MPKDLFALLRRPGLPSFVVIWLPGLALLEVGESIAHDNVAA